MSVLLSSGVAAALLGLIGLALAWATRRYPSDEEDLVKAIDACLPQTQCAQCGYPGCLPYARAIRDGAPLDLCPPGGQETLNALRDLLPDRPPGNDLAAIAAPLALIDEAACIGCALCLKACPVDAIIGAPQQMHTVFAKYCTGCELCIPPCPVDCITLVSDCL